MLPSRADSALGANSLSHNSLRETPFANGWLCFESEREKRRLAPIPAGWESRDAGALEHLCEQACRVPSRLTRSAHTSERDRQDEPLDVPAA